jgi:hypothetical protein
MVKVALTLVLAVTALALWAMDQPLWCACGQPSLWSGQVASRHNSQHLADPYTVSHVTHGVLFALALRAIMPAAGLRSTGLVVATALEAGWEILENTDFVIRRYRTATMSLDYFGDSVANAVGDVAAMVAGYVAAVAVPWGVAGALLVALEVGLGVWIRDGLFLNLLMLVWPIDAIKAWQLERTPHVL